MSEIHIIKKIISRTITFITVTLLCVCCNNNQNRTLVYTPYIDHYIVENDVDTINILSISTNEDKVVNKWTLYKRNGNFYTNYHGGDDIIMSVSREIDTTFSSSGIMDYGCKTEIKRIGDIFLTSVYMKLLGRTDLMLQLVYDKNYVIKSIRSDTENAEYRYE